MQSNPKKEILHYFKSNFQVMLFLILVAILFFILADYWDFSTPVKNILYSLCAGVVSSLIYSSLTDYNNKSFYMDVLEDHQISYHLGGKIHTDHRDLLSRSDALYKYLRPNETLKVLTLTADDYLKNEKNREIMERKMDEGAKVKILLFSPVYNLRSYLDKEINYKKLGQRHLTAVELIREHASLLPEIVRLKQKYSDNFSVKFFTIGLHLNLIIYGTQRIYSAPIMRSTKGRDLPCFEFFQGVKNNDLYNKFSSEFDYIWNRPTLHLTVEEVAEIYQIVISEVSLAVANYDIHTNIVDSVEKKARDFQQFRERNSSNSATSDSA